jgi:hypothetical protein
VKDEPGENYEKRKLLMIKPELASFFAPPINISDNVSNKSNTSTKAD